MRQIMERKEMASFTALQPICCFCGSWQTLVKFPAAHWLRVVSASFCAFLKNCTQTMQSPKHSSVCTLVGVKWQTESLKDSSGSGQIADVKLDHLGGLKADISSCMWSSAACSESAIKQNTWCVSCSFLWRERSIRKRSSTMTHQKHRGTVWRKVWSGKKKTKTLLCQASLKNKLSKQHIM